MSHLSWPIKCRNTSGPDLHLNSARNGETMDRIRSRREKETGGEAFFGDTVSCLSVARSQYSSKSANVLGYVPDTVPYIYRLWCKWANLPELGMKPSETGEKNKPATALGHLSFLIQSWMRTTVWKAFFTAFTSAFMFRKRKQRGRREGGGAKWWWYELPGSDDLLQRRDDWLSIKQSVGLIFRVIEFCILPGGKLRLQKSSWIICFRCEVKTEHRCRRRHETVGFFPLSFEETPGCCCPPPLLSWWLQQKH